jgi:hypothetical protein
MSHFSHALQEMVEITASQQVKQQQCVQQTCFDSRFLAAFDVGFSRN